MTPSHLSDDVGRVLGGRYRLLAPVGTGASARVYLAEDVTLRRRVAVKILHDALASDESFLRRFRAEAQAAASLNHPHVLGVFDWGHDAVPYLVTEYLGGGSLRSMIDAGHLLTASQALMVGLEAARGLEYAHARNLVHRDIKPANLLFDEEGRLRIADFGLARALAEAGWTEPSGAVVGTARYAAPEQARGERLGARSDVYALALVLNEAVTGDVPFPADSTIATLMARLETPFEASSNLGPLQSMVGRAGTLEPDERPDAGEFAQDLLRAAESLARPEALPLVGPKFTNLPDEASDLTQLGASPAPPSLPSAPLDDIPKRRWPGIVLSVLLVLAGVAGGIAVWQASGSDMTTVPELAGLTQSDAAARVADLWVIDPVNIREAGTEPGEVVRSEPAAGEQLAEGEQLRLYVSLGEPKVDLPDVYGRDLQSVIEELGEKDILITGTLELSDETLTPGTVIGFDLPADVVDLEPGSEVVLFVSSGPAERQVPEVPEDGLVATARDELVSLRLIPREDTAFSADVPEGEVIGFVPTSGAFVAADTPVTIVVSDGPEPVEVPNVIGLDVSVATFELEELGFVVERVEGSPSLPVLATDPPAGEVHPFGTSIVIATEL